LGNVFEEVPRRGIYPLFAVDYDLILLGKDLHQTLPIKVVSKHVKGHYKGDYRDVQHDLNDLADEMAEQFRLNPPPGYEPSNFPWYHPAQAAVVLSGDSMITSKLKQVIYESLYFAPLMETIWKRNKWGEAVAFNDVDWLAFGSAFKSYSRYQQIGLTKMVNGLWHTGTQQVLFKLKGDGMCPCCREQLETTRHVYQCIAPNVVAHRQPTGSG
jgi:hypothetical protein